jgi:hypothetical protein
VWPCFPGKWLRVASPELSSCNYDTFALQLHLPLLGQLYLPNNVDSDFGPELLAEAREPHILSPMDFGHSRFEALCSSIKNM